MGLLCFSLCITMHQSSHISALRRDTYLPRSFKNHLIYIVRCQGVRINCVWFVTSLSFLTAENNRSKHLFHTPVQLEQPVSTMCSLSGELFHLHCGKCQLPLCSHWSYCSCLPLNLWMQVSQTQLPRTLCGTAVHLNSVLCININTQTQVFYNDFDHK